jgi:hypothetical protein
LERVDAKRTGEVQNKFPIRSGMTNKQK